MNIVYQYMYYSIVYIVCVCCECTIIQYYVILVYLYVMSLIYVVYSISLYYYIHLYSCNCLDLVQFVSVNYTIVLCLYMHLYMYDSLILYDCYVLIYLVYILVCVVIASAGSLPNIEHLFGQQCSTVLLCCQVVQVKVIARLVDIEFGYSVVCGIVNLYRVQWLTMI